MDRSVVNSAGLVTKLGARSSEIGQIVDTIAGQTKTCWRLMRQSKRQEQVKGRGFAVVRKLAEPSHQGRLRSKSPVLLPVSGKAMVTMTEGAAEAKKGSEVVDVAGRAFSSIEEMVKELTAIAQVLNSEMKQLAEKSEIIVSSAKSIDSLGKELSEDT